MDYEKLGLKVGFEIHQQLDTHKLFCECPSILRSDKPSRLIVRKLKAMKGELAGVDIAALMEELKGKTFIYEYYDDTNCLVELDEEPPHFINEEALVEAIKIAKALNMKLVDEAQVMRKTVIDGSCVSGFQRTVLIAYDGFIRTSWGKVKINSLCLEEDSARKMKEEDGKVYYRLDRLGIPLVEIQTEPFSCDPKKAREVAELIGLTLRLFKVKKGIGTIRQDVNVSIKGGARVEIKGFQKLELMEKLIENEVKRQLFLIELKKRRLKVDGKVVDLTDIFSHTNSGLIKNAIERGGRVLAMKLDGMKGILCSDFGGKRFARDLLEYAQSYVKFGGFIHSDELPGYGISEEEIARIRERLGCKEADAFILIAGEAETCKLALQRILERVRMHLKGPRKEVRAALPDATTRYLREMPGAARMYPETDHPPIQMKKYEKMVKEILNLEKFRQMFELDWGKVKELIRENARLALNLKRIGLSDRLIYRLLIPMKGEIKREGGDPSSLRDEDFIQAAKAYLEGEIAWDAIPKILAWVSMKRVSVEDAIQMLGLRRIKEEELDELIENMLKKHAELARKKEFKILMGLIMAKVRGRIEGEKVAKRLKEKLGL